MTEYPKSLIKCHYCDGDISELSECGRRNHEEWCRVFTIPDVEVKVGLRRLSQ